MTGYIIVAVLFYVTGRRAERRALRRLARDTGDVGIWLPPAPHGHEIESRDDR